MTTKDIPEVNRVINIFLSRYHIAETHRDDLRQDIITRALTWTQRDGVDVDNWKSVVATCSRWTIVDWIRVRNRRDNITDSLDTDFEESYDGVPRHYELMANYKTAPDRCTHIKIRFEELVHSLKEERDEVRLVAYKVANGAGVWEAAGEVAEAYGLDANTIAKYWRAARAKIVEADAKLCS